jgi:hypothetical protein
LSGPEKAGQGCLGDGLSDSERDPEDLDARDVPGGDCGVRPGIHGPLGGGHGLGLLSVEVSLGTEVGLDAAAMRGAAMLIGDRQGHAHAAEAQGGGAGVIADFQGGQGQGGEAEVGVFIHDFEVAGGIDVAADGGAAALAPAFGLAILPTRVVGDEGAARGVRSKQASDGAQVAAYVFAPILGADQGRAHGVEGEQVKGGSARRGDAGREVRQLRSQGRLPGRRPFEPVSFSAGG